MAQHIKDVVQKTLQVELLFTTRKALATLCLIAICFRMFDLDPDLNILKMIF